MKKLALMLIALTVVTVSQASAAGKKSSWLPYPEWIKSKKR